SLLAMSAEPTGYPRMGHVVGGAFVVCGLTVTVDPEHGRTASERDGSRGAGEPVPEALLLRRNRQLEALYSVARAVNASLDLGDVLQQALEQVLRAIEFPSGIVRLLDAPTGELRLAARSGLAPELETELRRTVRVGDGPSGVAAQRRSRVVIED